MMERKLWHRLTSSRVSFSTCSYFTFPSVHVVGVADSSYPLVSSMLPFDAMKTDAGLQVWTIQFGIHSVALWSMETHQSFVTTEHRRSTLAPAAGRCLQSPSGGVIMSPGVRSPTFISLCPAVGASCVDSKPNHQAAFRGYRLRERLRRLPAREAEKQIRALHRNARGFRRVGLFLAFAGLYFALVFYGVDISFQRSVQQSLTDHLAAVSRPSLWLEG